MRRKIDFYLKWVGTILTLLFAILTSLNIHPLNIWMANISCVLWVIWAYRVREWSLVIVNGGLLLIYFIGFIKTLL